MYLNIVTFWQKSIYVGDQELNGFGQFLCLPGVEQYRNRFKDGS